MKYIAILFFIFLNPALLFAQGKVHFAKGLVLLDNKKIKKGNQVKIGQVLQTKKDALAIIKLNEGTTFKVNENSKIKIQMIKGKKKGTILSLIKGNAFFKYKKSKKSKGLRVKAKSVSMGVRGTEFFASLDDNDVWMCVNEGAVAVRAKEDKKSIIVKEGLGVRVSNGKKTSAPQMYPWTKKLNWNMDSSKGKLTSKIKIEDAYSNPLEAEYD